MKILLFFLELPIRFVIAILGFTFGGWIGWLGIVLVVLRFFGVIHWQWWAAALPLEYGVIYCIYMTIDGALYRAGLKKVGSYARATQFESREAYEAYRLSEIGPEAYMAEKEAEIQPKIDAMLAETRARQKEKQDGH
jgi:hypothetical protein